ncbi:DUF427 domain-containing protein [Chloroflexota bacterium]
MVRAIWNGEILAESNDYETVEGNIYFPPSSVKWQYLKEGDRQYTCPWSYPDPKEAALNIKDHVAFEGSVEIAQ